ncbi:MAG: D-aminoacylase [Kiloniellales bacterium]|nr:D-aminoacylase [Kiloniellales bacterium]
MAADTGDTAGREARGRAHLILRGGLVIDGTGGPARRADVAVEGARIAAVGDLAGWRADQELDAAGFAVAPGFIDVHTHDDRAALASPDMAFKVSQGVTTVIAGNCGISLAPFRPGGADPGALPEPIELLGGPDDFFPTVADYRAALERSPPALNLALFTGHGMLRVEALGRDFRRSAEPAEIAAMGARLREALAQGSLGLSSGLDYPTSSAASTEEVVALARHVSGVANALYVSHIRDEADEVLDALDEAFAIGRGADLPVVISHHKCAGPKNHGRSRETLAAIDAAARDQRVGLDVYPYTASSTVLLAAHVAEASDVLIGQSEPHPEAAGRWLKDLVAEWGCGEAEAIERLKPAGAIYFQMADEDLERILAYPRTMVGSDGLPGMAHPHPRLWGTFPRVLARYVRDKQVLDLEQAVHRMTGLAAETYRLTDRGLVRPGQFADLTLFDPATVRDRASYEDPERPADGIRLVLVNGAPVWDAGAATGARPGRFLARSDRAA